MYKPLPPKAKILNIQLNFREMLCLLINSFNNGKNWTEGERR